MWTALLLRLQDYTFDLKYEQGEKMSIGDALCRLHIKAQEDKYDVMPLNLFKLSIHCIFIPTVNTFHIPYTNIMQKIKYK